MNPESIGASQGRKKSDYRTKLNPKKKTKDTQNYKPKYSFDFLGGNNQALNSSKDSSEISNHGKKSKRITQRIDDESHLRQSDSAKRLDKFIVSNTERKNSEAEIPEDEKLPSEMWWVSPLKAPSTYKPPSIAMSSKSYSIVSSISRPRVIRSAEDLRKKVISQCNLIEAAGYDKIVENTNKIHETTANVERVSSNQLEWVPSLSLPSASQTQSETSAVIESASPNQSSSKTFLPQNLTVILHSPTKRNKNNLRHSVKSTDYKVPDNSFDSHRTMATEDLISKKTFSNQSSQYEDVGSLYTEPFYTMGDIARKHIVNPIASKLARLCTRQGQLYLDIIDDLEKSCQEFENACNCQVLEK